MPSDGGMDAYRKYRAPRTHGEVFSDPPLSEVSRLIASNLTRRGGYQAFWSDGGFDRGMPDARLELVRLAREYTSQYRNVDLADPTSDPTIFMGGHQPQLYHPGVWYKNFVLSKLAAGHRAIGINLIVDNDFAGPPAIRVPTGSVESPRLESVHYDERNGESPFEEYAIRDQRLFNSFGERVAELIEPFVKEPLIKEWWPTVIRSSEEERNFGRCVARARHELEGQWGVQTLELPLSTICETTPFRRFLLGLLSELPRFREVYNEGLVEYRRVNRIRSHSHPAPDLQEEDGWLEAPFWIWTKSEPVRSRLFVRRGKADIELSDRKNLRLRLPLRDVRVSDSAVDALAKTSERGVRIRPRALLTTMYARMMLCDLFVHGIGGGKYDQLTDGLIRRFFEKSPPDFLVLTATAKLPIDHPAGTEADLKSIEQRLRDLTHNPDRHMKITEQVSSLIEEKRNWLRRLDEASLHERHHAIRRINVALQPHVSQQREQLEAEHERTTTLVRNNRILESREFSFCLFPKETLQALLLDKR